MEISQEICQLKSMLAETNEKNVKLELELCETKKKCAELDSQVKNINLKQHEFEEKIRLLEGTCVSLCAQVAEKNDTMEQMGCNPVS